MKRCPECRRDYYDDTLSFCLSDGTELVYGLVDEPPTAILSEPGAPTGAETGFRGGEDQTRPQINTTDQTAIFPGGVEAEPQKKLGELSERQAFWYKRRASVARTPHRTSAFAFRGQEYEYKPLTRLSARLPPWFLPDL